MVHTRCMLNVWERNHIISSMIVTCSISTSFKPWFLNNTCFWVNLLALRSCIQFYSWSLQSINWENESSAFVSQLESKSQPLWLIIWLTCSCFSYKPCSTHIPKALGLAHSKSLWPCGWHPFLSDYGLL